MKRNNKGASLALATVILAAGMVAGQAQAEAFKGNDEATSAYCERYRQNGVAEKQAELERHIPKPANEYFSTNTCLDQIMNTRINIFTMDSLDGLLDKIINMATNRACSAVLGVWNDRVGAANQVLGTRVNVPYIGTVGGTTVGYGYGGSPVTVNGQPATPQTIQQSTTQSVQNANEQSQSALGRAAERIKNIFK